MDKKKRLRRDRLQNLVILALSISAVYLFFLTGSLEMELPEITLSSPSAEETPLSSSFLQELDWPVTLVIHNGSGERRYRQLSTSESDFTSVEGLWEDLFRDGFTPLSIPYTKFESALSLPGIYVSFPSPIPLCILSERLGLPSTNEAMMQHLLLVVEDEAVSFYYSDGEHFFLSHTSLKSSDLIATADVISGNRCAFAFEQKDSILHPLTVLPDALPQYPQFSAVSAVQPANTDSLLAFFGFNAHTTSRYVDSSGTEVIVESPRRLSITPGGHITYLGSTSYAPEGFTLSEQPAPALSELVDGAYNLLTQLCDDTDLRFYLSDAEYHHGNGKCTLRFSRMAEGLPLLSGDGKAAAELLIEDGIVVSFRLLRRSYSPSDTPSLLLPLRQASAIAERYDGMEMALSYVDNGSTASVSWLMR